MKRCCSAPCLTNDSNDKKKLKLQEEPNAREYLQLALARVLELQREIKEGTYTNDRNSELAESSSEEDLTEEVVRKVFENLPGTPSSVRSIIEKASRANDPRLDAIHGKRIQLLGYDTCRRVAVNFMKNTVRQTRKPTCSINENERKNEHGNVNGSGNGNEKGKKEYGLGYSDFRVGTYSRNEPSLAYRRTGLLKSSRSKESVSSYDQQIRDRMLRSLDLHLAHKQMDYTAKLMRSAM